MHIRTGITVVVTVIMLADCARGQQLPEPIDLTGAQALTDREWSSASSWGKAGPVPQIIDGDEDSWWWTGIHDLDILPANVFIVLDEPATVGMMEIVIEANPDPEHRAMRIGNMEIYARAGDGWARIGEIRDNDQHPRIHVELTPSRVQELRLRILRRSETYRAFAKINEVRLYPPPDGVAPVDLEPAPVSETEPEQFVLRAALGLMPSPPKVAFDAKKGYLGYVQRWFETMAEEGTDRYGESHSPMFCSILDLQTRSHPNLVLPSEMTMSLVPTVTGQRTSDRSDYGGNLQHDVMAILAAHHVSEITGDDRYSTIARDYLSHFLDNCTDSTTGLWPWGEHAYWNFFEEQHGRDTHHLLCAPLEFYELAYSLNPDAVIGLCSGLINHITDLDTFVFNRHADITRALPSPRPDDLTSLDFANSASRFLRLWSFAYSKTGDEKYLDWCDRLLSHIEWTRIDGDGPLPILSARSTQPLPHRAAWPNTLLVGLSLLEYAPMLAGTETGERFLALGEELIALVAGRPLPDPERPAVFHTGRGMGGDKTHPAQAYRVTGNDYFLEVARGMAMPYLHLEDIPEGVPMRAQSYAVAINLMIDMHELDGDPSWLEAGERYARLAIETLYSDGLFRGAPGLWYQDSHLGTATLIHALVRVHAAAEGLDVEIPANVYGF